MQRLWDTRLRDTHVFLILCGSTIGLMEREVLTYRAPLYGRRTGQYLLQTLELPKLASFFPHYSPEELVTAYAILGGTPAYLRQPIGPPQGDSTTACRWPPTSGSAS